MPPRPERDAATLLDIDQFAERATEFVRGMTEDDLARDVRVQSAVLHAIVLMGEAVKRLSSETRAANPHIPWADIAGMRDMLIHQYDGVDLREVWKVTQSDAPELRRLLAPLLQPPAA